MADKAISMTRAASQYLSRTTSGTALVMGTADFAWEFIIKIPTTQAINNAELIESQSGSAGNYQISLPTSGAGANSINWQVWNNGSSYVACTTTTSINDGACHHVAVRRVGNSLKAWIDGTLEGNVTTSGTANLNTAHLLYLGNGNGGIPTSLQVSHARVWKTTIPSDTELGTGTATSLLSTSASPIGDWDFENDANDNSGNALHWTVTGSPGYVDGCIISTATRNPTVMWWT